MRHNLRGAKIAVLSVGINYKGQSGELQGCINDSNNFLTYARTHFAPQIHHQVQMVDSLPSTHAYYPTKQNIQGQLIRALQMCKRDRYTHFWFHYSGHGAQQRDRNGDEEDGLDETLVPIDHARRGMITDDWLLARIVNRMPTHTFFFALIDACHSGSMMDLRFNMEPMAQGRIRRRLVNRRSSNGPHAMMISGCRDHQYSYDTWDKTYGATGAMSVAFLRAVNANRKAPVMDIVRRMRADLQARGYPQIPQLSSSRPLNNQTRVYGIGTL